MLIYFSLVYKSSKLILCSAESIFFKICVQVLIIAFSTLDTLFSSSNILIPAYVICESFTIYAEIPSKSPRKIEKDRMESR